jgi:hypothetical protein
LPLDPSASDFQLRFNVKAESFTRCNEVIAVADIDQLLVDEKMIIIAPLKYGHSDNAI